MDQRTAQYFVNRKASECIQNFPYDLPLSEEGIEELNTRVWESIEEINTPDEFWAILQSTDCSLGEALSGAIPIQGFHGATPILMLRAETGVKYSILHNILYKRCEELLPELRRAEHGIVS